MKSRDRTYVCPSRVFYRYTSECVIRTDLHTYVSSVCAHTHCFLWLILRKSISNLFRSGRNKHEGGGREGGRRKERSETHSSHYEIKRVLLRMKGETHMFRAHNKRKN